MTKKSNIYTKTGDQGETSLFGGERVSKANQRIKAIGKIDQLNAALGVISADITDQNIIKILEKIQNQLFQIGAEIANPKKHLAKSKIKTVDIKTLEKTIDLLDSDLPKLANFILPSGSRAGSLLHFARTICRETEREVVILNQTDEINPNVLRFLNRLSDLLFVLARKINFSTGISEKIWKSK